MFRLLVSGLHSSSLVYACVRFSACLETQHEFVRVSLLRRRYGIFRNVKGTIYEIRGATEKRIPIRGQVRASLSFEWHLSDGKLRFTIENRAAAAQPFVVSLSFFKCFSGDGSNSSQNDVSFSFAHIYFFLVLFG